jgi:hypothetical protein
VFARRLQNSAGQPAKIVSCKDGPGNRDEAINLDRLLIGYVAQQLGGDCSYGATATVDLGTFQSR